MEEPTCITSCLICESQLSPTKEDKNGEDTDMRTLVSILKKILLQQNEADVTLEKENSEATRLFCPGCTEILDEWHEIQGYMSKLLTRSKDIKYRLIANILKSSVSLPGQLLDSAAFQEYLDDFAVVKRAVINEYQPSLLLERLAEIPLQALRNCFDGNCQNDMPVGFREHSGFDQEDYNDDWETPTFDATDSIEFEYDGQSDDELSIKSSSTSGHVMKTRKEKRRPPTERHDAGENKRIKRTVVVHENGDILYDGKYNIKLCGEKYACPMCGKRKKGKYNIIEHIRVDHIRAKTHEGDENKQIKRTVVVHKNGDILYDGKYNIKLCGEKYACPMCGLRRKGKYSIIEHIREDHIREDHIRVETHEEDENKRIKRTLVVHENGDILYAGKYTIKSYDKTYLCPMCALSRKGKRSVINHILEDHIRGMGTNEVIGNGENSFLYLNKYGFTFVENQYKCTTCGIALDKRSHLIAHIRASHINRADKLDAGASEAQDSQPDDTQLPPQVSESCTIETNQPEGTQLPSCVQPDDASETQRAIESIEFDAIQSEKSHLQPENQSSDYNGNQETSNAESRATDEYKQIKRSIVVLENGDILYDGKYTIKLCGKKYLCPVCGLQRNNKYTIAEHIRAVHIVGKAPSAPEIIGAGENCFLYLNQYGFSFSDGQYKCTTCGLTHALRHYLLNHIQVSHVNGADKDKDNHAGKVEDQPSSSFEQDVNELENAENTEQDPDWHQTDSSDSEAQSEQDSDGENDEEEPVTEATNESSSGPRKIFKCIAITQNVFLYADKYRIVFKAGRYQCPKCSCMSKRKLLIMQHIRAKHMKNVVVSQKVQPFNRIVTINENEFMYGGKYRIKKINNRFFCPECPCSRTAVVGLADHIRAEHIRKKDVPEVMTESEEQSSTSKTARYKMTKIGPNEYLHGGQVRISMNDGVFKCGSCGMQTETLTQMRYHATHIHIRRANDEFYKSVQRREDGTFKCGKCDYIGKNWNRMYHHILSHKNILKKTGSAELRKTDFSVEVSPNHFDHGGWPYKFVPETGRFNCGSCNWTFKARHYMIRHIALYHRNPVESMMCDECGKVFPNKDTLRFHKSRHRPKTIPCPECGKLFSNQDNLSGHRKIHLGDAAKKNVCEFCGKRFYKLNQLEKHRATHTGEAPYNCDECGLGYRTQRDLKNHQSTDHPKETVSNNVAAVDANDAVVSIEIVDGVITDISSV